ncbi:hypothetical protein CesoFtcFv8_017576 [Champsocephalus esox]|uniref:Uncharacterized protein n=1 Tax=Champsocephalus esox TaxID=159716 RepID=A0AAN8GQW1_9TELE|nr:hypothetical protein CesoFtcFv8_017576 [Champsocephalus esox]
MLMHKFLPTSSTTISTAVYGSQPTATQSSSDTHSPAHSHVKRCTSAGFLTAREASTSTRENLLLSRGKLPEVTPVLFSLYGV